MPPATSVTQSGYEKRWTILALVFVAQLSFAIIMQSVPPVLNLIIRDMGISHAQAGLLMGIFALPGIFLSIPAGSVSDKYGPRYLCLISLALMILGTVFSALAGSFYSIVLGRFISGIGALTLIVVLPQFLSQWFLGKELGIAMGIFNTVVPVGGLISFNLLPVLTLTWGWRAAFWLGTAASVIALLFFILAYSPPPGQRREQTAVCEQRPTNFVSNIFALGLPIWLVSLSWMWFNAGFVAFTTFAPDFFVQYRSVPPDDASRLASLSMWGPFLIGPFVGMLIDRFHRHRLFVTFGNMLAAALILVSFQAPGNLSLLMIAVGIGAAFIPSTIYHLPAFLVSSNRLGLAFGIISSLVNLAILGGPYTVGFVHDLSGSYFASFITISLFLLLSILSILPLKKQRDSGPARARQR